MIRDIKHKLKQLYCNLSEKQAGTEEWGCMEDINAAQNGKKWNYLESSERHQMQRHSSTQIGSTHIGGGMPNRQQDTGECTNWREFWHCGEGKNPNQTKPIKPESQTNLNCIDKRKLGKY